MQSGSETLSGAGAALWDKNFVKTGWNLFVALVPLLIVLGILGWLFWHWLKRSDDPLGLVVRSLVTGVVGVTVLGAAAMAKDPIARIAVVLLAAFGGLVVAILWAPVFCAFVGDQFAKLYDGGGQPVEPAPFYSIAQGRRKRGQYVEAIAEVQKQLAAFPNDFPGWMMLAEIYAEDLKDLASAHYTVEQILAQEGHASRNIAYALSREADWHLKLARDRQAARAALERIVELLPETEEAQLALQRIAHLTPEEMLAEQREPRRVIMTTSEQRLGLRLETPAPKASEDDPAAATAKCVQHLEQFPYDNESREKLALLYANHYQRLDLATEQLEQLIAFPNQPAKQVVHWLNLLADVQVRLAGDAAVARQTLQRIIDLYPQTAAAETALNRIAYLRLELRPKQASKVVKLGSYEQNLGLRTDSPPRSRPDATD